ncbi:MAG: hypothetical protein A3H02_02960 [Candidatus Niyogibacteria bacterium RIFCSPLOWO2_12_FULL_41_13]|uniref:HicB-like antitoxin of toxin-antitoxin system domain-containing protein n=1 Tax=Candidatus Niyogibacteria bacterium RIFCSPLOWO2_12_FULL_41_13 TaxID=1801726 RepID=A0A1G2F3Y5_9BACT|nr:MAG: hypothetical protein A3H02_02960 [Candidatus Niyogibacteria bacterium RIFCSPLOWO2_12_FULL_41_13]
MKKKHITAFVQTQYGRYECLLESDEKKGFIVTASGLPGVTTWGKNIAHAKKMAKEAIELCIECRVETSLHGFKTKSKTPTKELLTI